MRVVRKNTPLGERSPVRILQRRVKYIVMFSGNVGFWERKWDKEKLSFFSYKNYIAIFGASHCWIFLTHNTSKLGGSAQNLRSIGLSHHKNILFSFIYYSLIISIYIEGIFFSFPFLYHLLSLLSPNYNVKPNFLVSSDNSRKNQKLIYLGKS